MIYLLIIAMGISHLLASAPAWTALKKGTLPPPVITAVVSFLMYYDLGILFEVLGFRYDVIYFPSIFDVAESTQRFVLLVLTIAPWILIVGAQLTGPSSNSESFVDSATKRPWLRVDRRRSFYLFAWIFTLIPAWYGLSHLLAGVEAWNMRAVVGSELGPFIILLSLPMHILAFYAATEDARTPTGRMFTVVLAVGAICASIVCGQRTLLLFPAILTALAFFRRVSLIQVLTIGATCVVLAAAILPLMRGAYLDKSLRADNLVVEIIHNDFSRAGVIATVAELSPPVGTDVLPQPMAGYKYASLFFVPRNLAPFKGRSTAMHFTGFMMNERPEWLNWGFGVGMIEELMLNVGTRYCLLGVFCYGLVIGLLTKFERTRPTVSMPLRLGPIFLCGYHLPSVLLTFGTMWMICTQLSWVFADSSIQVC